VPRPGMRKTPTTHHDVDVRHCIDQLQQKIDLRALNQARIMMVKHTPIARPKHADQRLSAGAHMSPRKCLSTRFVAMDFT